MLEALFVTQYLWMAGVKMSTFWADDDINDDTTTCQVRLSIWPAAWLTQFTLLGGELWFAVLSIDLYLGLTNPFSTWGKFTSTKSLCFKSVVLVYGLASISATVLVTYHRNNNYLYGLSGEPFIWVREGIALFRSGNVKLIFFFIPLLIIYAHGLSVFLWAKYYKKIDSLLEDTIASSQDTIRRQSSCK